MGSIYIVAIDAAVGIDSRQVFICTGEHCIDVVRLSEGIVEPC